MSRKLVLFGCLMVVGIVSSFFIAAAHQRRKIIATMDKRNFMVMGLQLHWFHDGKMAFPQGTAPEARSLPFDERLSWMALMLPYLDRDLAKTELHVDEVWNSDWNQQVTSVSVPLFQNPHLGVIERKATTHYVGVAGLGGRAATLASDDPKAGIFGYDRRTQLRDIKDGTANTIMMMGIQKEIGPWGQGGRSTVRGFSAQPYIGGSDGFGGVPGGAHVLCADGSVYFLSKDVDPKVMEALVTKAGGEEVTPPWMP